jgi:hypothetical protein
MFTFIVLNQMLEEQRWSWQSRSSPSRIIPSPSYSCIKLMQLVESKEQRSEYEQGAVVGYEQPERGADKKRAQPQELARVHYILTKVVSDFPNSRHYIVRAFAFQTYTQAAAGG